MLRKFLTVVLPIALPFIVYFMYVAIARWRGVRSGEESVPWPWLTAGGVMLVAAVLIGWRVLSDPAAPGDTIIMPRLEGGEVRPSEVLREGQ